MIAPELDTPILETVVRTVKSIGNGWVIVSANGCGAVIDKSILLVINPWTTALTIWVPGAQSILLADWLTLTSINAAAVCVPPVTIRLAPI